MSDVEQAVILAGGLGTRLRPLTYKIPKPMIPINGSPFLEYLIALLKENNIRNIVICVGYLAEKIIKYFGDGSKYGVKITYSVGDVSFETGKRLKHAEALLNPTFLLMYCDNYWPLQLEKMIDFYKRKKAAVLITVYTNKQQVTKNNVLVGADDFLLKYDKSRQDKNLNGVEIGFLIVDKSILSLIDENCNFEEKVYPILIDKQMIVAYKTDHRYYSISTPEKLKGTEEFLKPKKVILLDRDGVNR